MREEGLKDDRAEFARSDDKNRFRPGIKLGSHFEIGGMAQTREEDLWTGHWSESMRSSQRRGAAW